MSTLPGIRAFTSPQGKAIHGDDIKDIKRVNSGPEESAMPESTKQNPYFRGYYESRWAARAEFMRFHIRAGESNAYRIIKKLEAHERKFILSDTDRGLKWLPLGYPEHIKALPGGVPAFRISSIRGKAITVPFHATDNLHDYIVDYIDQTGPYDCIVELGCGYGRRLFEIFYSGGPRDIPYFGGELTASGVAIAGEIAALQPDMQTNFFRFDYLKPDLSAIPRVERALVYTVHSIEQVTRIAPELFRVIAGIARHVTCIHLEPFGFQVKDQGPVTQAQRRLMLETGWNLNFAEALFQARDQFGLKVDFLETEIFLPQNPDSPTSIAIWSSSAKAAAQIS
jgi:hypothetical protein